VFMLYDLLFTAPRRPGLTLFPYTTLFRSNDFPSFTDFRHLRNITQAIKIDVGAAENGDQVQPFAAFTFNVFFYPGHAQGAGGLRSEEHTSELQSRENLVCRLLLEKKKKST